MRAGGRSGKGQGPRRASEAPGGSGAGRWIHTAILLAAVLLFCITTHWGRNYSTFARKTWIVWTEGRALTGEERRRMLYDETYPGLVYLRENTPPDAVILLPPEKLIDEKTPGDIPLLASPSSVYNFIYPRVPVHWGDPSPFKDEVNYLLVWKGWGLDLIPPGEAPPKEGEIALYPWPPGRRLSW
jgi:hypothetical protein